MRPAWNFICARFHAAGDRGGLRALELNPYRLYSWGCVLLTADNGGQLVRILAEKHIPAQVIGRVNKGIAREMIVQEGRGFLERPQPDEITKVIPDFFK